MGAALGFSNEGFGLFAGTAVNDTSSVTAAASAWDGMHPGSNALDTATIVKLTRTLAIIPITLALAFWRTSRMKKAGKEGDSTFSLKKVFPFFIIMAMAAIGLNTDIVKLVKTGGKPIFMGLSAHGGNDMQNVYKKCPVLETGGYKDGILFWGRGRSYGHRL